jgi:hypothetical protein
MDDSSRPHSNSLGVPRDLVRVLKVPATITLETLDRSMLSWNRYHYNKKDPCTALKYVPQAS